MKIEELFELIENRVKTKNTYTNKLLKLGQK